MSVKNVFKNFFYLEEDEDDAKYDNSREQQSNKESQQQQIKQQKREKKQQVEKTPMAVPQKNVPKRKQQTPAVIENDQFVGTSNLVSFTQKTSKLILFEPRVYSEAENIGDCLKNKRAAVINLQRIDKAQGKRIIDFLSGTIFALNGDIKKIGEDIFLCTPDNVEVDGTISDYYFDE